ncbi:hypothetical protein L4C36_18305 [Photobacterium japonica]|uniref:hypothetical protein n=1 Tax=Photobacterium japonica TaxID=2910235 RepID=UPI003D14E34B
MQQNKNQNNVTLVRPRLTWKKRAMSHMMILVVAFMGMMTPAIAEAHRHGGHKHHKHKHHHKHHHHHHYKKRHKHVVVVKERHHHYHKSRLPEIATFAIIAGATYAIIDNHYYKRRGENYEYVAKPNR